MDELCFEVRLKKSCFKARFYFTEFFYSEIVYEHIILVIYLFIIKS